MERRRLISFIYITRVSHFPSSEFGACEVSENTMTAQSSVLAHAYPCGTIGVGKSGDDWVSKRLSRSAWCSVVLRQSGHSCVTCKLHPPRLHHASTTPPNNPKYE